jgi:hypothetical protein
LKLEDLADSAFKEYQSYLEDITVDIPDDDRANYFAVNQYNIKQLRKFSMVPISSRTKDMRRKWNELLFNIANVYNVDRIKFLIEKGIKEVISPWRFRIWEYSERIQNYSTFPQLQTAIKKA